MNRKIIKFNDYGYYINLKRTGHSKCVGNSIRQVIKIISVFLFLSILFANSISAEEIIDKKGRVVDEIIKPTAKPSVDPDTISDAIRYVPDGSKDLSKKAYEGPSKNIFSKDTIFSSTDWTFSNNNEYTLIRHTPSITDVDEDRYYLTEDVKKNRLRLTIIVAGFGEIKAKNGFYKISDRVYYFDEDGLMVLGPAYDNIGNYYYFSYDTGELLEEKQVR